MKRTIWAGLISAALLAPAIFAQATPAVPATRAPRIRHRYQNQQKRIAQGVASGELTPRETAKIERNEARLRREVARDRVDGGGLTARERAKIDRHQNQLSREIYRQKHDRN